MEWLQNNMLLIMTIATLKVKLKSFAPHEQRKTKALASLYLEGWVEALNETHNTALHLVKFKVVPH